ncbi:MAG: hypothetical protein ACK4HE_03605 [Chitinophagaceae bacterium]
MLTPQAIALTLLYLGVSYVWFRYRAKQQGYGLTANEALLALTMRVLAGWSFSFVMLYLYDGQDTWEYHREGLKYYALLKKNPLAFLAKDITEHGYTNGIWNSFFSSENSFFKDLQHNLVIKLYAIMDVFSGGRYYVNVLLYNLLIFSAPRKLYLLIQYYWGGKQRWWWLMIFCFPTALFFTSAMMKDGLCFWLMMGAIYRTHLWQQQGGYKHIMISLGWLLGLLLIRHFMAITLLPVLVAFAFTARYHWHSLTTFISCISIAVVLFFATAWLPPQFNLMQRIAERQDAFHALKGTYPLPKLPLNGTPISFMKALPAAVNHAFFQPGFVQVKTGAIYLAGIIDWVMLPMMLGITIALAKRNWKQQLTQPFTLLLISICCANYLVIGYTVPFIGAIIRYRALFALLWLLVMLSLWKPMYRNSIQ